jgi:ubiquinone/menaquinone biosynthesis C-methylase UbiE
MEAGRRKIVDRADLIGSSTACESTAEKIEAGPKNRQTRANKNVRADFHGGKLARRGTPPSRSPVMATTTTQKGYRGIGMEGLIARWYARTTRPSLPEFQALARRIAEQVPPGSSVLEVAPGPGYFAIELAKIGGRHVTGLDISHTFVEIARRGAAEAGVEVEFRQGNVSAMPFPADSFDYLLCRAAFKNFSDPPGALAEMHRVLKPGGRALIIDLRRDASPDAIRREVQNLKLGAINAFVVRQIFRFMLIKRAYTKGEFRQLIAESPFHGGDIHESLTGVEITLMK